MKVPGAERAIVDEAKVRDYLLSNEHPIGRAKARFFAHLGFERESWRTLHEVLCAHVLGEAELTGKTAFGQKYVVRSMIQGPSGISAPLTSVWIVLEGEQIPRFVTAYPG